MSAGNKNKKLIWLLFDWVGVYIGLTILLHLLLVLVILWLWPTGVPRPPWGLVEGIAASAFVAVLAGIITIIIGSWTSMETEKAIVEAVSMQVKERLGESLSAPITTSHKLIESLERLFKIGYDGTDSILIIEIDPTSNLWSPKIAQSLNHRLLKDLPTWLIVPVPDWCFSQSNPTQREQAFWKMLVEDSASYNYFDKRNFLICPVDRTKHLGGVGFIKDQGEQDYHVSEGLICLTENRFSEDYIVGLKSTIDMDLCRTIAVSFCDRISEPSSSFSKAMISYEDLMEGKISGIQITRSLVTTQIIIAVRKSLEVGADADNLRTIQVFNSDGNPNSMVEFRYSGSNFIPPTSGTCENHSGSVVADLLQQKTIPADAKTFVEIGCGPGYLTIAIAQAIGDTGKLIAVDKAAHAIKAARANISRIPGLDRRVTFLEKDCLDLKWELHARGSTSELRLELDNNEYIPVDAILAELPLLPYFGTRELHQVEYPYIEKTHEGKALTDTIRRFLEPIIAKCVNANVSIYLPICASDLREQKAAISELNGFAPTGSGFSWKLIGPASGFIRCLQFSKDPIGKA
jgi:SAM-dependent methyltransferase